MNSTTAIADGALSALTQIEAVLNNLKNKEKLKSLKKVSFFAFLTTAKACTSEVAHLKGLIIMLVSIFFTNDDKGNGNDFYDLSLF